MQQFFIAIIFVLGLSTWYLFNQNETLTANNIKLESAVEEQKRTMEVMKEQYEKQGKSLLNMSRRNAEIEQEKAEYLSIFSRHNLDLLALKKPGMIELRMNNASKKVMEGMENDTKELFSLDVPNTTD